MTAGGDFSLLSPSCVTKENYRFILLQPNPTEQPNETYFFDLRCHLSPRRRLRVGAHSAVGLVYDNSGDTKPRPCDILTGRSGTRRFSNTTARIIPTLSSLAIPSSIIGVVTGGAACVGAVRVGTTPFRRHGGKPGFGWDRTGKCFVAHRTRRAHWH